MKKKKITGFTDYVVGWSLIEIRGFYGEQMLNALKEDGIDVWDIRRVNQELITLRIHTFSAERLFELAEKLPSLRELEVSAVSERGLLSDVLRYKLRAGIAVGLILSAALFFVMTSFIWKLEITGLHIIPEEAFVSSLEELGFSVGSFTFRHNLKQIKFALMEEYDNLAYVTININGCKAEIEVTERIMPPAIDDEKTPCNIYAKKDGEIIVFETYQGKPQTTCFSAVRKGQLLVGGIYDSKIIGYRMVHADAKIMARTRRTFTEFCPYIMTVTEETGRTDEFYELYILGLRINLSFLNKVNFVLYDDISEETELILGEKTVLPVSVIKHTLYEQNEYVVLYDDAAAKQYLTALLDERLRVELHGLEIEDITVEFTETENGVYCTYDCTVIEDICEVREIETEIRDK